MLSFFHAEIVFINNSFELKTFLLIYLIDNYGVLGFWGFGVLG